MTNLILLTLLVLYVALGVLMLRPDQKITMTKVGLVTLLAAATITSLHHDNYTALIVSLVCCYIVAAVIHEYCCDLHDAKTKDIKWYLRLFAAPQYLLPDFVSFMIAFLAGSHAYLMIANNTTEKSFVFGGILSVVGMIIIRIFGIHKRLDPVPVAE